MRGGNHFCTLFLLIVYSLPVDCYKLCRILSSFMYASLLVYIYTVFCDVSYLHAVCRSEYMIVFFYLNLYYYRKLVFIHLLNFFESIFFLVSCISYKLKHVANCIMLENTVGLDRTQNCLCHCVVWL